MSAGFSLIALCASFVLCIARTAQAQQNLIVNSTFEAVGANGQLSGWEPFWSRTAGAGSMVIEPTAGHAGGRSLRVEHNGKEDWSVGQSGYVPVHSGEIFSISGWVKSDIQGDAGISVVTRDAAGKTLDWSYGAIAVGGKHDWMQYHRKLVAPDRCATMQFRLIGYGNAKLWLDSPTLSRAGTVAALTGRADGAAERPVEFGNKTLHILCDTATGALSVTDTRTGLTWRQQPLFSDILVVRAEKLDSRTMRLQTLYLPSDGKLTVTYTVAADKPQVAAEISGDCALSNSVPFPHPFANQPGSSWLVIPMNEGVLYPVDDTTAPTTRLVAYGGHGICMPWVGQITGKSPDSPGASGVMTLFNTPDDASIDIGRPNGIGDGKLLLPRPLWDSSRGRLSYTRKLTYLFTDGGGYVAQAKLYRRYAIETGLFKTLAQKRAENPNVDKLVGAVNVWAFGFDKLKLCNEMKSLGMDRVLWSGDGTPAEIDAINKLGYLTSRYDIYQDVWPPEAPDGLKKEGWPDDLVWLPNGGDSSNKAPEVWDKRDLINILYATPPLFMMNGDIWKAHKDRFVASYEAVCGVARQFGYDEMVSHHFLTADHTVQSTEWRSGSEISVNMGESDYKLTDGTVLKAGGWLVRHKPAAGK